MFMFLISQFYTEVVSEIKKLWPGIDLVTGKPHHSESNGVLRNKIGLLKKKSQTGCIIISQPIGHKHYRSNSDFAIPKLTGAFVIGPHITDGWQTSTRRYLKLTHRSQFLSRLATEMNVCHSLCLLDMPLDHVNCVNSPSADESFENPWLRNNFQDR